MGLKRDRADMSLAELAWRGAVALLRWARGLLLRRPRRKTRGPAKEPPSIIPPWRSTKPQQRAPWELEKDRDQRRAAKAKEDAAIRKKYKRKGRG